MEVGKKLQVTIERFTNEGYGVALYDGLVIFVPDALVGEEVRIKITELKKNYAIADLLEVLKISNERTIPICPFYDKCGGCDIMHMSKDLQLKFKKNKIENVFRKICNMDVTVNDVCSFNSSNYRNKVVLRVEGSTIGFYEPKSNKIIDVKECLICDDLINETLLKIREFISYYTSHGITEVMIRVARDEVMVYLSTLNKRWYPYFIKRLNNVTSIYVKDEYALKNIEDQNVCADLYSGTGTIAMSLAKKSRRVIAIESNESAVEDAKENMVLNGLDNIEFKLGRVEDLIDELIELNIDTLVLDPPRTGSDKRSLRALLKIKPKNIIYISCNPVTLARDYNVIKNLYDIVDIQPFDMFPNTHHVETVMVLERKN